MARTTRRLGSRVSVLACTLAAPSIGLAQTVDNGHHPVWAPDGRIYFHVVQGPDVSIYSVDPDGSDLRRVTTSLGKERSIAWSPDGQVAVFMAADGDEPYDLHGLEPDGSGRPLVVRPGQDWDPVFSPDGNTLVWMATSTGGEHDLYLARPDGHNDIHEMVPDGSGSQRLTDDPAEDNGPRISPDGRRIAFFSDRDGDFEIYVMHRDGSAPRRVTSASSRDVYSTWSPDGAWLAFESDRSGTTQIYRIRPDGTGLQRLTGPQTLDPCASEIARQFDFWIGEWTVTQEIATQDGGWETYQARSTVAPALDGCALVERWEGTVRFYWEGMTEPVSMQGLSVRAPGRDGSWRIHWMDSRDPTFEAPWIGGFESGVGTFVRNAGTGAQTRIRFFDVTETSVEWELALSANAGSTWTPLWRMHFRRER